MNISYINMCIPVIKFSVKNAWKRKQHQINPLSKLKYNNKNTEKLSSFVYTHDSIKRFELFHHNCAIKK